MLAVGKNDVFTAGDPSQQHSVHGSDSSTSISSLSVCLHCPWVPLSRGWGRHSGSSELRVTGRGDRGRSCREGVEVFGLCPARLTITFLSLADVRPVPRPVVPYGKRSFGSRSAVLTANRAIASTERVRDGRGRRGKKEKKLFPEPCSRLLLSG